ncbi:hypothetical protein AVEN_153591-1 [Araneus ventricosus]|uniref:Uncharacterized protein n=1 Tax=Araneus ventricosus TaxID=182803 RepID=A0A4Y2BRA4_ARAVE|nr:hypothetical protein AVEN_153591-1 [Araneus ventricosus]
MHRALPSYATELSKEHSGAGPLKSWEQLVQSAKGRPWQSPSQEIQNFSFSLENRGFGFMGQNAAPSQIARKACLKGFGNLVVSKGKGLSQRFP